MHNVPIEQLSKDLSAILSEMDDYRGKYGKWLRDVHSRHTEGASNLMDYLAFRQKDRTGIQNELSRLGLSSLGRSDAAIRQQILQVRSILDGLCGDTNALEKINDLDAATEGRLRGRNSADRLFGSNTHKRSSRIMVTLPTTAAQDSEMITKLLSAGMDVARINCAHDDQATWRAMADQVRKNASRLGVHCLVACDLAGPKLRTGQMPPGPRVLKVKPSRSLRGKTIRPAKVCLFPQQIGPPAIAADAFIPIQGNYFDKIPESKLVALKDTRGKERNAQVLAQSQQYVLISVAKTTYFETGQKLSFIGETEESQLSVGQLDECENYLTIALGDELKIVADGRAATPAVKDEHGNNLQPAIVSCATREVLDAVQIGHQIKLDDGKFTARVTGKEPGALLIKIERCPLGGAKLKAEKGVNFPDTELPITGITPQDKEDLKCVVEIADLINQSFVNTGEDIEQLIDMLDKELHGKIGIILKIETPRAFDNLPELLLTAMRWPNVGVMIARGDLGVEAGWQSVAQLQEEILWLSTAAHIPCIWATQVLETLAKTGTPTRAEITDAAMAQRAECVMLNKGPYVHEAIAMLNNIIKIMDAQQEKKSALLPQIKIASLTQA